MRHEMNRIIDIEYMRIDQNYCRHVIGLAATSGNGELKDMSDKLSDMFFGSRGLFVEKPFKPLLSHAEPALPRLAPAAAAAPADAAKTRAADPNSGKYVGRLR